MRTALMSLVGAILVSYVSGCRTAVRYDDVCLEDTWEVVQKGESASVQERSVNFRVRNGSERAFLFRLSSAAVSPDAPAPQAINFGRGGLPASYLRPGEECAVRLLMPDFYRKSPEIVIYRWLTPEEEQAFPVVAELSRFGIHTMVPDERVQLQWAWLSGHEPPWVFNMVPGWQITSADDRRPPDLDRVSISIRVGH